MKIEKTQAECRIAASGYETTRKIWPLVIGANFMLRWAFVEHEDLLYANYQRIGTRRNRVPDEKLHDLLTGCVEWTRRKWYLMAGGGLWWFPARASCWLRLRVRPEQSLNYTARIDQAPILPLLAVGWSVFLKSNQIVEKQEETKKNKWTRIEEFYWIYSRLQKDSDAVQF